jgi:hypothetical protein
MDFAVDPARAETGYAALWQQLCAEEWSTLDLWGLMEASPTREAVRTLASEAGFEVSEEREAVSPRLQLPSTWDDYLASLGKKDRHELRRKMRRLFDSGARVEMSVYDQQADVATMDEFLRLHTVSRSDRPSSCPGMPFSSGGWPRRCRRRAWYAVHAQVDGSDGLSLPRCRKLSLHVQLVTTPIPPFRSGCSPRPVLQWAIENGKQSRTPPGNELKTTSARATRTSTG